MTEQEKLMDGIDQEEITLKVIHVMNSEETVISPSMNNEKMIYQLLVSTDAVIYVKSNQDGHEPMILP